MKLLLNFCQCPQLIHPDGAAPWMFLYLPLNSEIKGSHNINKTVVLSFSTSILLFVAFEFSANFCLVCFFNRKVWNDEKMLFCPKQAKLLSADNHRCWCIYIDLFKISNGFNRMGGFLKGSFQKHSKSIMVPFVKNASLPFSTDLGHKADFRQTPSKTAALQFFDSWLWKHTLPPAQRTTILLQPAQREIKVEYL